MDQVAAMPLVQGLPVHVELAANRQGRALECRPLSWTLKLCTRLYCVRDLDQLALAQ